MGQKKKFHLNMWYVLPILAIVGFIGLSYLGSVLLIAKSTTKLISFF